MKRLLLLSISVLSLASCKKTGKPVEYSQQKSTYDSIATVSQQVLLTTVQQQLKKGGPAAAVSFCSEKALPITDSLSERYQVKISRISDRNRNPENAPKSETDRNMLTYYSAGKTQDTIISSADKLTYYKPIKTGLPACLQCHGQKNSDIKPATLALILEKYPHDKATGYALNDFRGLWKIEKDK